MINKLKANKLGALTNNKVTPDKVNEIIDSVNNAGLNYKVYTAILNQSGANAPTEVTILSNNLGYSITYNYVGTGSYSITPSNSTGIWDITKTYVSITNSRSSKPANAFVSALSNLISIQTTNYSGTATDGTLLNNILEIRVYN